VIQGYVYSGKEIVGTVTNCDNALSRNFLIKENIRFFSAVEKEDMIVRNDSLLIEL